jgi:hypothetical protein
MSQFLKYSFKAWFNHAVSNMSSRRLQECKSRMQNARDYIDGVVENSCARLDYSTVSC